jgi:hypothetical protein
MSRLQKEAARNRARWRRASEAEEKATNRILEREASERAKTERQQRIAERKARPTIREAVLDLLPAAVERASEDGYFFNTRHLVYAMREEVRRRTGKMLVQGTFDRLLTEHEAHHGELHPRLIREDRGYLYLPLEADPIPLGTLSVREYRRAAWLFNKLVVIEKNDLARLLQQAGFCERHDCAVMTNVGFSTRAGRDLIDAIAATDEPVQVFSIHDGDSYGTLIHHTLQHATLARGARRIEIIDLGLQPWEGVALGLQVEEVEVELRENGKPKTRPVGEYVRGRTDRAPSGETWEQWLQRRRVELNAFTPRELVDWLDRKMSHFAGKVIPPCDILVDQFANSVRDRVGTEIERRIDARLEAKTRTIVDEKMEATRSIREQIDSLTATLRQRLREVSAPFDDRIRQAAEASAAIDQVECVEATVRRMLPEPDALMAEIAGALSAEPRERWATVLRRIAETAAVPDESDEGESDERRPV